MDSIEWILWGIDHPRLLIRLFFFSLYNALHFEPDLLTHSITNIVGEKKENMIMFLGGVPIPSLPLLRSVPLSSLHIFCRMLSRSSYKRVYHTLRIHIVYLLLRRISRIVGTCPVAPRYLFYLSSVWSFFPFLPWFIPRQFSTRLNRMNQLFCMEVLNRIFFFKIF